MLLLKAPETNHWSTGSSYPAVVLLFLTFFYADDAIFVGEWDKNDIKNLARILKCFHISSGLKVNFHKSRLFGVGTSASELQSQAHVLGGLEGSFPFSYLGVPVGANMLLKRHWKPIIEKFQSRLSTWKAKALSFGGRTNTNKIGSK